MSAATKEMEFNQINVSFRAMSFGELL